jgi:acid phosphatase (class A)
MISNTTTMTRLWPFNRSRWWAVLFLFSILAATTLRADDDTMTQPTPSVQTDTLHYLRDSEPNAIALLAPPPLPGSPEQAADMAEVRAVCHAAPSNDVAVAFTEKKFSILNFTPAIGPFLVPGKFPKTEAFLGRVQKDAETVTDQAKDFYKRPRPYVLDPSLASGRLEKSFSYPSGHSTESMVLALVLAEVFPDKHDTIIAEARNIGWHRVEIARHYPTDIYAGRVLAQAIVREMNKNTEFQQDLAAARAEVAPAETAAKN